MITQKTIKGCHLTGYRLSGFLIGSVLDDAQCLIKNGFLNPAASFIRSGDVQLESGAVFGPNENVKDGVLSVHHGQIEGLLLNNETLSDWTIANCTPPQLNSGVAPDESNTAIKIIPDTSIGTVSRVDRAVSTLANNVYTAECYLKPAEYDIVRFLASPTLPSTSEVVADLSSGVITHSGNTLNHGIKDVGSGWWYLFFTFEAASASTRVFIQATDGTTTGNNIDGFLLWLPTCDRSRYPINPIVVRAASSTVAIDTAASDLSTLHGSTVSIYNPVFGWLWDLLDGKTGSEMVENFSFTNGTSGWLENDFPVLSVQDNTLRIENAANSASDCYQELPTTVDRRYRLRASLYAGNVGSRVFAGTTVESTTYCAKTVVASESEEYICTFKPQTTITFVRTSPASASPGDFAYLDFLSLKEIGAATGTLTYKNLSIIPSTAQWQTVGDKIVLIAQEDGTPVFYIDKADGKIKISDGTNVASSLQPYTAGQAHTVSIVLGGDKMQLFVDGINGPVSPFTGTLINGTNTLKFNYLNEDITTVEDICGASTSDFSEAIHLAQELAHTL